MERQQDHYNILSTISEFKKYRPIFSNANQCNIENQTSIAYFSKLLSLPASSTSVISDPEWDFNLDNPNVSPNIRGSKLKINFNKYRNVPPGVVIELKCLLLCVLLTPDVFINNRQKAKKKTTNRLAVNTVLAHMKSGLRFLDTLFNSLHTELGVEYVKNTHSSLTQINTSDYEKAALQHDCTYNDDLRQFFSYIQNPHTSESILGESIPAFNSEQFYWKKRYKKKASNQIMPNWAFDKLVRKASLLVHDFLQTMGEDTLDLYVRRYASKNESQYCIKAGVTKDTFHLYRAFRLLQAGYSEAFVNLKYGIPDELRNSTGKHNLKDMTQFLKRVSYEQFTLTNAYEHISLVANAAKYLIGQYTGMRPSELAAIDLHKELIDDGGIKLLQSNVYKGKDSLSRGLFDDKWVVIPIIEDALKAIRILNSITQRRFVYASGHTKKPLEKEKHHSSVMIRRQIDMFITYALPNNNLGFSNYMMRHTLAYQLYRLEAGLPLISFQLKHLVNTVDKFLSRGATSDVTMGYGGIADCLVESQTGQRLRKQSEIEVIKATADPNGNYLGGKASEHKDRLQKVFNGYMASGYSKEEIFEAMAEQGLGVINVGLGYCYGADETNLDLPCIGSLRCNPIRCSNAIVSEANAPYWLEIYMTNRANLNNPVNKHNYEQITEVMNEAKQVLDLLGHCVNDE
ncbi:site-specific integrase [Vibrio parahaemolyticus]